MSPETIGELISWAAGLSTAVVAVIGAVWRVRKEKEDIRNDQDKHKAETEFAARRVAIEESANAVAVMGQAMEELRKNQDSQSRRITDQGRQITDLTERVSDVTARHQVAIEHIAQREVWTAHRWASRPKDLPAIPVLLVADVVQAEPTLQLLDEAHSDDDPDEDPE